MIEHGEGGLAGQEVSDEVIYLRAAGLDLGKRFLVACVRVPHPIQAGRWSLETQKFGTTPRDIRSLAQWLVERRVEVVVLETTSDYWRGVYYTVMRGQEVQRLEKELEDTGMKLTSVLSDVLGVTGRAILQALIDGERDPQVLAGLAVKQAKRKTEQLIDALDGTFTDHHAWMCRHYLAQIDHINALIAELDARIAALTSHHADDLDNLDTIPGIGRRAAEIILAETGGDMTEFATAAHLASWIGVSPGINESAGVSKSLRGKLKALVAVARSILVIVWHLLADPTARFQDLGPDYHTNRVNTNRKIRNLVHQLEALGHTVTLTPVN